MIAEHNRAHDVSRSWLYFGLTRLGVGMLEAADESWSHAERHWRELGKPLHIHRILLQRSWISVFRGRFAEAVELVAQAREFLDSWPRSNWLQYARLDDHLAHLRADALADMNFDGIGNPSDDWQESEARYAASSGTTRLKTGPSATTARALEQAAELKIPAALAVDSVRYSMTDADARWRWLRRDEEGVSWLETPVERGRIEVEDAPFVAVELDWTGEGRRQVLLFRTMSTRSSRPGLTIRSASRMTC